MVSFSFGPGKPEPSPLPEFELTNFGRRFVEEGIVEGRLERVNLQPGEVQVLFHLQAGLTTEEILQELGTTWRDGGYADFRRLTSGNLIKRIRTEIPTAFKDFEVHF